MSLTHNFSWMPPMATAINCFQVRDRLWVGAMHSDLETSPKNKIWEIQVWWMPRQLSITPAAYQPVSEMVSSPCQWLVWGVRGGYIVLGQLQGPENLFPSTEYCPEPAKHLDMLLGVDCPKPLIAVLDSEWPKYGYGNPGSAFWKVYGPCRGSLVGVLPQMIEELSLCLLNSSALAASRPNFVIIFDRLWNTEFLEYRLVTLGISRLMCWAIVAKVLCWSNENCGSY